MLKQLTKASGGAVFAVLLAGLLVGSGGCANTNNAQGKSRGASLLVLDSLEAVDTASGNPVTTLFSDVLTCDAQGLNCGIVNDNADAKFSNIALGPSDLGGSGNTAFQTIQMYRLTVQYTRGDGHNIQGVDIPYNFDAVMAESVSLGGQLDAPFVIVRHVAKEERPLVDLVGAGDESIIYTNTRCDFFGRDLSGNEHQVYGWLDIEFGDFVQQ